MQPCREVLVGALAPKMEDSGMNTGSRTRASLIGCALLLSVALQSAANADTEATDAAKLSQNPVANVISVPFQNNANLNAGPERDTQNVLNVQPVIPLSLSENWNVITRTIVPLISSPALAPGESRTNGVGDALFTAFLSPAHPRGWIWGVGPAIQAPTHSNDKLGNNNWGAGPSFVVLHLEKGSPWVYGVLLNNVWSLDSSDSRDSRAYSHGLMQPFVNYNMAKGWYLVSSPIVTVDWKARGSQQWTVPVGGGAGKIVHWGHVPVSLQLAGYYNVAKPDDGPNWQVRAQAQFLFPKKK
jgi:hypothetical protein